MFPLSKKAFFSNKRALFRFQKGTFEWETCKTNFSEKSAPFQLNKGTFQRRKVKGLYLKTNGYFPEQGHFSTLNQALFSKQATQNVLLAKGLFSQTKGNFERKGELFNKKRDTFQQIKVKCVSPPRKRLFF